MRINLIKISNYRQYKHCKIDLKSSLNGQNFSIIQGPMGSGKSNILNAITWCLYGKEVHLTTKQKGLPLLNTNTIDEMAIGDEAQVIVELQMLDDKNKRHHFIREATFCKEDSNTLMPLGVPGSKDISIFKYLKQEGKDMVTLEPPKDYVEQLMPSEIKEYFFVDNEQLNAYFKETSGETIKKAIFDISQLKMLDQVINRLEQKAKEIMGYCKKASPNADRVIANKESSDRRIQKFKEDLDEIQSKFEKNKKLKTDISKQLRGFEESESLEEERLKLEQDAKKIEDKLTNLYEQKKTSLIENSLSILTADAFLFTKNLITTEIEDGRFPPDVRKDFLESLLKHNKCICGSSLKEKSLRDNVEHLLKTINEVDVCTEVIEMQGSLRHYLDNLKSFSNEQTNLDKLIKELESDNAENKKRQTAILKELGKFDKDKIIELQQLLEKVIKLEEQYTFEISSLKLQLKQEKENNDRLIDESKEEMNKQKAFAAYKKGYDFTEAAIGEAKKAKQEIVNEVRSKIEEQTRSQFFKLIWNPEFYKDIKIDENYNISIIDNKGREGLGTLSAGQRQILTLSFIAALNNVSGFKSPIVIDTPLGRISKIPKRNIASNLPKFLKDHQVIMLVTEEEYTSDVRKHLKDNVVDEYQIVYNGQKEAEVINYATN